MTVEADEDHEQTREEWLADPDRTVKVCKHCFSPLMLGVPMVLENRKTGEVVWAGEWNKCGGCERFIGWSTEPPPLSLCPVVVKATSEDGTRRLMWSNNPDDEIDESLLTELI